MTGAVEYQQVEAVAIDAAIAGKLAQLLSRAYTDARHLAGYTAEERERWAADIERVHRADGESMPEAWLTRFPTVRNLRRPAVSRHAALHLTALRDGRLASHVGIFEQRFAHNRGVLAGAFIEDVATDPDSLGLGLASALLAQAVEVARDRVLPVVGLATAIPEFYERLGWCRWRGPATFVGSDGSGRPDPGLMVLETGVARGRLFTNEGEAITTFRL